ncbi:MAG: MOSC domain-containing protein [Pseudomonadota bacterium]
METIAELIAKNARPGIVQWIGVRPERRGAVIQPDCVELTTAGLVGDHNQSGGKRAVTLVQQEHLSAIASFLGQQSVDPVKLRRNFVVSGINLLGLRNRQFNIGNTVLEGSGLCAPCSRMEEAFGPGGYSAVRGHGGITARIVKAGSISISDEVTPV